jgi:hypothetical protein
MVLCFLYDDFILAITSFPSSWFWILDWVVGWWMDGRTVHRDSLSTSDVHGISLMCVSHHVRDFLQRLEDFAIRQGGVVDHDLSPNEYV